MVGLLRRAFARRRTLLAPNADWMVPRLEACFDGVAEIRPNPFGVSSAWFDVERRPEQPPEWLVVSRVTRKKLGDLLEWGDGLFNEKRRLRLLGPQQETFELPEWVIHEGHTNPDELRNHWFPRAAGLLTLSRHDEGRPQVMIEAMAAGLPVIASDLPAHADLIRRGETGWLVSSPQELVDALSLAEQGSMRTDVGANASRWIRGHIGTWDDSAARCIAAYRHIARQDQTHASA
jgi:glycosyltransferase involved in cell wall biosynthesis